MKFSNENSTKFSLILLIVIAFFASTYCSEPQRIPMLAEGPIIANPYVSDKPSACTVVSSQYDDPTSPASTTSYTTSSLRSLASTAQFGTSSTTTTI